VRQPLPLRDLPAHPRGDPPRGQRDEAVSRIEITRRTFVAALGGAVGGLALGVRLVPAAAEEADPKPIPSVFVQIGADGLVSIVCSRSEMGQGIRSSLPVVLAAELGAAWNRVRVVPGDAAGRVAAREM